MLSGRRKKDYAAETSADALVAQAAALDGQALPIDAQSAGLHSQPAAEPAIA